MGLLQINLVRAQAETLSIEILAGYNLVVDSNVESPSTYAPSVATVGARFCNTGANTLTDVSGYIGNFVDGVNDTPGVYPARNSNTDPLFQAQHSLLANTGSYAFTHVGGSIGQRDASRYIGDLAPGECRVLYWHFTYPRRANPNNSGVPVWGQSSINKGFDNDGDGRYDYNAWLQPIGDPAYDPTGRVRPEQRLHRTGQ